VRTNAQIIAAFALFLFPLFVASAGAAGEGTASRLAAFADRAARQQPVTIAFFGGSITWGATATDPLKTSWRARVMRHLRQTYPHTPIEFVDAAIGGQPSRLGVFRMDRDILPHKPDLLFLEFSVNDGDLAENDESYEGVIRKLRTALPEIAIVPVVVGGVNGEGRYGSSGRENDLKILAHYGLPVIDLVPRVADRVQNGLDPKTILTDRVHPSDAGYALYAELIVADLTRLIAEHRDPSGPLPPPLTANRFERAAMIELSKLKLPESWKAQTPTLDGTWFDHAPSRWFDSTAACVGPEPLIVPMPDRAVTGVGLYYEIEQKSVPVIIEVEATEHLTIETTNRLQFARVNYQFKWLPPARVKPQVSLRTLNGGPAKVGYLLYTTAE
jgi:lysophospholipase L1-like esterase